MAVSKPKLGDTVLVDWLDAWSHDVTQGHEEAESNVPLQMHDVGFLIGDTDDGVTLAMSNGSSDYRHIGFIPRGMIQKVKKLK